jgi:hypothetical protein
MIEWINNKFGTDFSENDIKSIKDFSLLWNIFENLVCNKNCSIKEMEKSLSSVDFKIIDFEDSLTYFKERYISSNNCNERFEYLRIPNDKKEFVKQVLLGKDNNVSNIILALAIIVYRYRNNLFHGEKNFMLLNKQEENFKNANEVIKSILKYY